MIGAVESEAQGGGCHKDLHRKTADKPRTRPTEYLRTPVYVALCNSVLASYQEREAMTMAILQASGIIMRPRATSNSKSK